MDLQNKSGVESYIFIGKAILVFLSGGIVFHMIVMVIDYYLMIEPFYLNMRDNFSGSIFSEPMMPMIAAYGLLSLGIYFLWEKTKKAVLVVREKEFQKENAEAVLKSMQRLTGIMAEHIASQNSEIMSWIEFRKGLGHPVPAKVENPSKQIGMDKKYPLGLQDQSKKSLYLLFNDTKGTAKSHFFESFPGLPCYTGRHENITRLTLTLCGS